MDMHSIMTDVPVPGNSLIEGLQRKNLAVEFDLAMKFIISIIIRGTTDPQILGFYLDLLIRQYIVDLSPEEAFLDGGKNDCKTNNTRIHQ